MVDFDPVLAEIVTETKYMEQLGFSVPELARNVALQASNQAPTAGGGGRGSTRTPVHVLICCNNCYLFWVIRGVM